MRLRHTLVWLLFLAPLALAEPLPTVEKFTEKLDKKSGYFDVIYKQSEDKIFLRIDKLNQDFLFQSSLPQGVGSNDIGLDRGQLGSTRLARFERFGNKVLLKQLNTEFRVTSKNNAERASIDEAFADSVIAGLPIVAESDGAVLVDYTAFLLSDIHNISDRLDSRKQGNFSADPKRSGVYLPRTRAFPDNTELEALVTYGGVKAGEFVEQVTPDPKSITVHLHHSLIRLPDEGFQQRAFHPYSGFWKHSYQDYSTAIDQPIEQRFIPRHRLRKKDPTLALSEAVEPIIYYLDPGIPEPVMSALRDGARWWNDAFKVIGYQDAFQVKVLPPGADPMDVRYNVIQWVHRATRGWSYGFSVIDPRTGEIIKGHVTLGSLRVRQDFLIALGLTSPYDTASAGTEAQQQMALARIRQLSAHEVGHTLGIAHNFAASANRRASVMDYPHPLVKVVDGKISLDDAYASGMGAWDMHVIAYGYQDYTSREKESLGLAQQVISARAQGLLYKSDPDSRAPFHATQDGHLWDNGRDPIAEFSRISEVRRLALEQFGINTIAQGQSLSSLEETLVPIYLLHRYQLDALVKLIGGVDYEYELKGDYSPPKGVSPVDAKRQQQALALMLNSLSADYLALPESISVLIPPKAYGESRTRESFKGRTGITFDPISTAESAAGYSLKILLYPLRLNRLAAQHSRVAEIPSVSQVLSELFASTLQKRGVISPLQSRLNALTINAVMMTVGDQELAPEVRADILVQVSRLHTWLKKNDRSALNYMLAKQLDMYWQTGEWKGEFTVKALPPGSPI